MNSKQLRAQRRRDRQKQKKLSFKSNRAERAPVKEFSSNQLWLNKRIQFEQMNLDSNGISLQTFQGTIVKVDLTSENQNDPIITVILDGSPHNSTKSRRIEALLGVGNDPVKRFMMSRFTIPSVIELVPKSKPVYSKPLEIGSFSYDSDRIYHPDRSELKQYKPSNLTGFLNSNYADLNAGRDKFISKPEDYQEHLDGLIKTLQLLPKTGKCADFVTWRGIITRIICTPFKTQESWSYNVMRRGNTVYIEDDKSEKVNEKKYPKQAMYTYWGHRFEHILMDSAKNDPNDTLQTRYKEPVNTWREFGVVFKSKLGGHRLVFGAEVDGLDSDGSSYVELKTCRLLKDSSNYTTFYQQKLMSFWTQSFLAGIPKILVGFRSDRGIVKSIEYIDVKEIPRITRGKVTWCPESMLNFGTIFLDWLSLKMKEVSEDEVYRISFSGLENDSEIVFRKLEGHPPFIPNEFRDAFYY